jgi:hypothetical protein
MPADERWWLVSEMFGLPRTWHDATANGTLQDGALHRDEGQVLFGIGVATHPAARGRSIATRILEAALDDAQASGVKYFLGYSRLPAYYRWPALALDAFLRLGTERGGRVVPLDHSFRLHWALGARPVQNARGRFAYIGIAGAMEDDPESRGAGVLIITPTSGRPRFPFERMCRVSCGDESARVAAYAR